MIKKTPLSLDMSMREFLPQPNAYATAAGWWTDLETDRAINPSDRLVQAQNLICSELSEAVEGWRKKINDDHLPRRRMEEVEYADTLIRCLDLAFAFIRKCDDFDVSAHVDNFDMSLAEWSGRAVPDVEFLEITRELTHSASRDLSSVRLNNENLARYFLQLSMKILIAGIGLGYDMLGATVQKMKYNEVRADHKPANRRKDGGKKA